MICDDYMGFLGLDHGDISAQLKDKGLIDENVSFEKQLVLLPGTPIEQGCLVKTIRGMKAQCSVK